ncbi:MAG: hypothetical protein HRT61_19095 [Ekhidna sp.]|nr:hypothetical protein [Ekhidna sp.]
MEIYRQITANNVVINAYPFLKELAMEAYLLENEEILKLDNQNFQEVTVLDAEIALKKGTKKGDGRIDILAKYGAEYLSIVELKVDEVNHETVEQLKGYLDARQKILDMDQYWEEDVEPKWVGVVAGSSISADLQKELTTTGITHDGIPIAAMTIKRFRSDSGEIYVITDTYFGYKYSQKDYSKFAFNGAEYNKGRLVNAVLKYFVEDHPEVTFSELKEKFPDKIQGSNFGVFDTTKRAKEIFNDWGHKRHYIKSDEIIKISDEDISTCTQWNTKNITRFIKRANELGLKIELI